VDPLQAEINGGYCEYTVSSGCGDAFIAKIRPDGSGLLFSTFFGGTIADVARGVTVDSQGNVYLSGDWGGGTRFPSTALPSQYFNTGAMILKIAPTGSMPLISARGVTNGASFQTGLVCCGIITIFGRGITNRTGIVTAAGLPLPTEINGVSVMVNGVRAPLFAIANVNGQEQINFQAPSEVGSINPSTIAVLNNGAWAVPVARDVFGIQPGIFTIDGSTGAIQHSSTFQPVTASNPAQRGEVVTIYATGLGRVDNDPGAGKPASSSPLSKTLIVPIVTIGGIQAEVLFSGLSPGYVGLYQVNARVPQAVPSGMVDVVMHYGFPPPPVKMAVANSPAPAASRWLRRR
jgi:uncharacterized protein (TIGR03437 family)